MTPDEKLLAAVRASDRLPVVLDLIKAETTNVIEHGLYGPVYARDMVTRIHALVTEAIACVQAIVGDHE